MSRNFKAPGPLRRIERDSTPSVKPDGDGLVIGDNLNPGVARDIRMLNATSGKIRIAKILQTGGVDVWSLTSVSKVTDLANEAYGREEVDDAIAGLNKRKAEIALRWMCRGLRPDRLVAYRNRTQSIKPEKPATQAGMQEMLRDLNNTSGEIDEVTAFKVRTGGTDVWSVTPISHAVTTATRKYGKEAVASSITGMTEKQKKAGIRWMCRGMRPDRYAAYVRSRERISFEQEEDEPTSPESPVNF